MKKLLVFIIGFLIFFLMCSDVSATTLQDLYDDLSALEKSYNAAKSKADMTQAELNNLKASIYSTENEIKQAQADIVQAETDIKTSETEIEKKKEETNQMLLYLQLMNSTGNSLLEYVFEAENYTDFIYRYAVVTQMSDYNQGLVDELNNLINQLNAKKQELSEKQDQLSVKKQELQEKYAIIQVKYKSETDDTLDLSSQISAQKKLIQTYENMGCSRSSNIATCGSAAAVDGWVYPLARFTQSSNYGRDEDRYHYAVDLAVTEGSTVRAVGNGRVIYSGVYWTTTNVRSCGGLVIQIEHVYNGVNYISLYMHMLSSSVSVGDVVIAGDSIGKSGGGPGEVKQWKDACTGGAHLHFVMAYQGKSGQIYNTTSSSPGTTFNPAQFFPAMKGIGSSYNGG